MSLVLALDTVTPLCSCALYAQGVCLARRCDDLGRGHGEHLIGQIEAVLFQAKIDKSALDRIAVMTGPGSFTGMRVGVATARALGLALGIRVVGVSRFSAINYGVRQILLKQLSLNGDENKESALKQHVCAIVLTGVQDQISLQLFDGDGTPLSLPYQERAEKVAALLPQPIILSGEGSSQLVPFFEQRGAGDFAIQLLSPEAELDGLAAVALIAPLTQQPPSPLYLRAPDAKPSRSLF